MKLLLFLTAAALFIVRRGEAYGGATSQGGMNYGVAGGVFGPSYRCVTLLVLGALTHSLSFPALFLPYSIVTRFHSALGSSLV